MINGNTTLSPAAQKAIDRIKALRTVSHKTGIVTVNEQINTLLTLDSTEMVAVADLLGVWRTPETVQR